jgi:hypothetical protein
MKRAIFLLVWLLASVGVWADIEWETAIGQRDQVTKGLVGYWAMRNSGTTVYDEWGGNNGGASNGVAFAYGNGVVGNGASFDGANDYINVPDSDLLDAAIKRTFAVSFWYARVGATATWQFLLGKGTDGTSGGGFGIFIDNTASNKMDVQVFNAGGDSSIARNGLTTSSSLDHYVIVFDGNNSTLANRLTVYINSVQTDGILATNGSIVEASANTYPLTLCERSSATGRPAKAMLDEVRLYNRLLYTSEIKQLYRMGATPRGIR